MREVRVDVHRVRVAGARQQGLEIGELAAEILQSRLEQLVLAPHAPPGRDVGGPHGQVVPGGPEGLLGAVERGHLGHLELLLLEEHGPLLVGQRLPAGLAGVLGLPHAGLEGHVTAAAVDQLVAQRRPVAVGGRQLVVAHVHLVEARHQAVARGRVDVAVDEHLVDALVQVQLPPRRLERHQLVRPHQVVAPGAPALEVDDAQLVHLDAVQRHALLHLHLLRADVVAQLQLADLVGRAVLLAAQQRPQRRQAALAQHQAHQRARLRAEDGVVEGEHQLDHEELGHVQVLVGEEVRVAHEQHARLRRGRVHDEPHLLERQVRARRQAVAHPRQRRQDVAHADLAVDHHLQPEQAGHQADLALDAVQGGLAVDARLAGLRPAQLPVGGRHGAAGRVGHEPAAVDGARVDARRAGRHDGGPGEHAAAQVRADGAVEVAADAVEAHNVGRPQVLAHLDGELGALAQRADQVEPPRAPGPVDGVPRRFALLEQPEALGRHPAELGHEARVGALQALLGEEALPLLLELAVVVVVVVLLLLGETVLVPVGVLVVDVAVVAVVVLGGVDLPNGRPVEPDALERVGRRLVHVAENLLDVGPDASGLDLLARGVLARRAGECEPALGGVLAADAQRGETRQRVLPAAAAAAAVAVPRRRGHGKNSARRVRSGESVFGGGVSRDGRQGVSE